MNFKAFLILAIALTLSTSTTFAQKKKTYVPPKIEDLPRHPIDTIATNDKETKVILYSNNTWRYFRPTAAADDVDNPFFKEHWNTEGVFAYRDMELKDLPNKIELRMVEDMSDFHSPILGRIISNYGPRRGRNHNGVDIPLTMYEPIYAVFDGKVRYAKYNTGGFGNLVIVRHANGLETWSAHLSRCNVASGDMVKAGQIIGFGGSTGRSRGPHLHFEIRYCDQTFDPEFIIDFSSGTLKYHTFVLEKSFFNIHSRATELLEEDEEDYSLPLIADGENLTDTVTNHKITAQAKPTPKATPKATTYHTIKSGDTLTKIASKYGVSTDQICRMNNITRSTTLKLGRKLKIK